MNSMGKIKIIKTKTPMMIVVVMKENSPTKMCEKHNEILNSKISWKESLTWIGKDTF